MSEKKKKPLRQNLRSALEAELVKKEINKFLAQC